MKEELVTIAKALMLNRKIDFKLKKEVYSYFVKNGYSKNFSEFEK